MSNTGPLCPGCKHRSGRHVTAAGGCLVSSGSGDRETFCVCEMTREEVDAILAWREADLRSAAAGMEQPGS